MRGAIGSLNAAVAGSILLFEAVAQRDAGGPEARPPTERTPAPPDAGRRADDRRTPTSRPPAAATEPASRRTGAGADPHEAHAGADDRGRTGR